MVADAGNAVEAHKLLRQAAEPTSSYECVLLAITYTLLSQLTELVSRALLPITHCNPTAYFPFLRRKAFMHCRTVFSDFFVFIGFYVWPIFTTRECGMVMFLVVSVCLSV